MYVTKFKNKFFLKMMTSHLSGKYRSLKRILNEDVHNVIYYVIVVLI